MSPGDSHSAGSTEASLYRHTKLSQVHHAHAKPTMQSLQDFKISRFQDFKMNRQAQHSSGGVGQARGRCIGRHPPPTPEVPAEGCPIWALWGAVGAPWGRPKLVLPTADTA